MPKYYLNLIAKIEEDLSELKAFFTGRVEATDDCVKNSVAFSRYNNVTNVWVQDYDCYEKADMKIKEGINDNMAKRKEEELDLPIIKEGGIIKRSDGRWMGRYYQDGMRKAVYASTKKEIITKLKKALIERDREEKSKVVSKTISLNKWIQQWLKLYKSNVKLSSYHNYVTNLVNKVSHNSIGKKAVSRITSIDIDRFMLTIKAPAAKARTFRMLKSCFRSLVKNRVLKESVFDYMDTITEQVLTEKYIPTNTELSSFLRWLKPENSCLYCFTKFVALTGLRKGEAIALTWNDIQDDKINIDKAYEEQSKQIQKPKTKASIRKIPLFPDVKDILDKIPHTDNRIFTELPTASLSSKFRKYVRKYGSNKLTIHSLRHYFATQCLEAGIERKLVQKWLGHSKYEVTINTYSHIKTEFENIEIDKLAKFRAIKD